MSSPAEDGEPRRVLIADNDANVSAILREFLVRRGLDVHVTRDGREALAWLEGSRCDVLICDLDMPVMTGHELLEELRDRSVCPPVVVISGYVDPVLEDLLQEHPAVRHVCRKPFDLGSFTGMIEAIAGGDDVEATSDGPGLF